MAVAKVETKKASYPMFAANSWWTLRKQFVRRIPAKVDRDYLAGTLHMELPSTQKLIGPLKKMGLIDEEGKPTERSVRWRDNDQYPSVCKEILEEIYPPELSDIFPDPSSSRDAVEKWFANKTGVGEGTAEAMAALFLLLYDADLSKEDNNTPTKAPASTKGKSTPRKISSPRAKTKPNGTDSEPATTPIADSMARIASPPKYIRNFGSPLFLVKGGRSFP